MPNGGLLRDPSRLWNDAAFQRSLLVQLSTLSIVLILSAFYYYVLRPPPIRANTAGLEDEEVAEIDSLIVYPLKGGRGIELTSADVSRKGFKFDRRWAIVEATKLKKLTLKQEPKITHIIPSFAKDEEGQDILHLRIGEGSPVKLPDIGLPLEPSEETLRSWPLVENIEFYGDSADGRQAQLSSDDGRWQWKDTPSAWASQLLGYQVFLLQFEPNTSKRINFPIFKPPHDLSSWKTEKKTELDAPTKIEFQDMYPFLLATRESLGLVNENIRTAIANKTYKADWDFWAKKDEIALPIQQFRPNVVLRSRRDPITGKPAERPRYPPFSEDSWETVWIQSRDTKGDKDDALPLHLVARCERCLLTTVDPETAHRDPNVPLVFLRKNRSRDAQPGENRRNGPCFGMYGIPEQVEGRYSTIHIGDPVRVRWRPYHLDDEVTAGARQEKAASAKEI